MAERLYNGNGGLFSPKTENRFQLASDNRKECMWHVQNGLLPAKLHPRMKHSIEIERRRITSTVVK